MEVLGGVASAIAVAQLAQSVFELCSKYLRGARNARGDIKRLKGEVSSIIEVLNSVKETQSRLNGETASRIAAHVGQCEEILLDIKARLQLEKENPEPGSNSRKEDSLRAKFQNKLRISSLKWPLVAGEVDKHIEVLERCKSTISLELHNFSARLGMDTKASIDILAQKGDTTEQERLLSRLPNAGGAAFDSRHWQHEPYCLSDTRVELLREISSWSEDISEIEYIYWLKGVAGTGKSTIARTVARSWAEQKRLGASFFFSRGDADLSNPERFMTTLAIQLVDALPGLRPLVCKAIEETPNIPHRGLADQWEKLIVGPLSSLSSYSSQIFIIVIDALDECDGERDVELIIRLLANVKRLSTPRLRIFITSRPETPIQLSFEGFPDSYRHLKLHEIPLPLVEHDIEVYLVHRFDLIRRKRKIKSPWPEQASIELLCKKSSGLFIYASTACLVIEDKAVDPRKRLSELLEDEYVGQDSTYGLDKIYTQILQNAVLTSEDCNEIGKKKLSIEFLQIVGSVVTLFDPLPTQCLDGLLDLDEGTVERRLSCLHSVLDVPDEEYSPVRLLHPSFRDFLMNSDRCKDNRFQVEEQKMHDTLAACSLKLMMRNLERDICNLRVPGALVANVYGKVADYIPLDVQYACRHWVYHLEKSCVQLTNDHLIYTFLQKNFLHWLEALSMLGQLSSGITMIQKLEALIGPKLESNKDLHEFVYDAKRFILKNKSMIEEAPLQTYYSALIFSPQESIIRRRFEDEIPPWLKKVPVVRGNWDPLLQSVDTESQSIAFSPDGNILASVCGKFLRLWDSSTGTMVSDISSDANGFQDFHTVVCSSEGLLAIASENTVYIWDLSSRVFNQKIEVGEKLSGALAFSSDGKTLATASFATGHDRSQHIFIKFWDPVDGSLRNTIKTIVGRPKFGLPTVKSDGGQIRSIAISPTGETFATGSMVTTELWEMSTGKLLSKLEKSRIPGVITFSSHTVTFSSTGLLASAGERLRLWNGSTGEIYNVLDPELLVHEPISTHRGGNVVTRLTFSPDGKLLVFASQAGTIKLWNVEKPKAPFVLAEFNDYDSNIRHISFSTDGTLLASASVRALRLWDPLVLTSTGASVESISKAGLQSMFDTNSQLKVFCKVSLDGQCIACLSMRPGSPNKPPWSKEATTLSLWNRTESRYDPVDNSLDDNIGQMTIWKTVGFSPDSKLLAFGCTNKDITIINPWASDERHLENSKQQIRILRKHPAPIESLAFSPDSKVLASAEDDGVVHLWNLSESHPPLWLFNEGTSDEFKFGYTASPDALCATLPSHQSGFKIMAFSPDCKHLVCSYTDSSMEIWELPHVPGEVSPAVARGHRHFVEGLSFSSDGKILASRSQSEIILWDLSNSNTIVSIFPLDSESSLRRQHSWETIPKERIRFVPSLIQKTADWKYSEPRHGERRVAELQDFVWERDSLTLELQKFLDDYMKNPSGVGPLSVPGIYYDGRSNWVKWGKHKLLWVPPEYCPCSVTAGGNSLFMGHSSGAVTCTEIDPGQLPPEIKDG